MSRASEVKPGVFIELSAHSEIILISLFPPPLTGLGTNRTNSLHSGIK